MHVCLCLIGNYLSSQWIATKLGRDMRRWQEQVMSGSKLAGESFLSTSQSTSAVSLT